MTSIARAERPSSVAVVVTERVNISAGEERSLIGALARGLPRRLDVAVMAPAEVQRRVPTVEPGCVSRTPCVRDLLRRLEVDDVLAVVLVRVGTSYHLDFISIDSVSGGLIQRPRIVISADAADPSVAIEAQAEELLPHRRRPAERRASTAFWVASGVAVASLAVGTYLGVSASRDLGQCRDAQVSDYCDRAELDSIDRRALGADVAFAVTVGAAVSAAIVYYWRPDSEGPRPSVAVEPGRATLGVATRF